MKIITVHSFLTVVALFKSVATTATLIETCDQQSQCIRWTKTQEANPACAEYGECAWKICMVLNYDLPYCVKDASDTVGYSCDNVNVDGCGYAPYQQGVVPPFIQDSGICVSNDFNSPGKCEHLPSGYVQCQYGLPGDTLTFVLSDRGAAIENPPTPFTYNIGSSTPSGAGAAFDTTNAQCDSASCTLANDSTNCGGEQTMWAMERVWTYTLGNCPLLYCPTAKPTYKPTATPPTRTNTKLTARQDKRLTSKSAKRPTFKPDRMPPVTRPTYKPYKMPPAKRPAANPSNMPLTQKPTAGPSNMPFTKKPTVVTSGMPTVKSTDKPANMPTATPIVQSPVTSTLKPSSKPSLKSKCVESNPGAFFDQDWSIMPVKGPNGELVGPGLHFWSNTAANLNNDLLFQWYAPNPAVVDIKINKLDFDKCLYPRDISPEGLTLMSPTYDAATRKYSLPISLDQTKIQQSDVWDTTVSGDGQIKYCMQIQAYIRMDCQPDILITHFNTRVTFRIHMTEGFALDTQSLQIYTGEANVVGSVETNYLGTPFLCDSHMRYQKPPAGGYLPGMNYCFCLRARAASRKEVYVSDVLNATAVGAVSLDYDFASSSSPYYSKTCNHRTEICRVCLLLPERLWPIEPCARTCPQTQPSCNLTASCLQGAVNITGYANVAFRNGTNLTQTAQAMGAPELERSIVNSFRIEGQLGVKTLGVSKKTVRTCTISVLKACKPCSDTCIGKAVKECSVSAFKESAKLETMAVLNAVKKKCVRRRK